MSIGLLKLIITAILVAVNVVSSSIAFYVGVKGVNDGKLSTPFSVGFSLLNHFSIGLFLGISILGLYSSSAAKLQMIQKELPDHNAFKYYPLPETTLCLGVFFLFVSEWCLQRITHSVCSSGVQKGLNGNPEIQRPLENISHDHSRFFEDEIELLVESKSCDYNSERSDTEVRHPPARRSKAEKQSFSLGKSVILSCALGLHSFFEGLGFGLLDSFDQIISMTIGMAMHQFLCAATLGFRLAQSSVAHTKRYIAILVLFCYLVVFPLGVSSGRKLHETAYSSYHHNMTSPETNDTLISSYEHELTGHIMIGLVQNFAASSFLYVILLDILPAVSSIPVKTTSLATLSSSSSSCSSKRCNVSKSQIRASF
ncbi:unnamed protein product [Heterobilharzia americana]|nr:unnamed protein product [Heterobilharzia americana]